MQSKILSRRTLLIAVLIGSVFFAVFFFIPKSSTQSASAPSLENAVIPSVQAQANIAPLASGMGKPVHLKIPKIDVDATIESVGLTSNGEMAVPNGSANVAWLKIGTRPGDIGSAVITGHYGTWKNGQGSVFDDLSKLHRGDKLSVEDDNGATIIFVVQTSQSFDPSADASSVFASSDGKSHLNLITCKGTWDDTSKSYSSRLVVFADKE